MSVPCDRVTSGSCLACRHCALSVKKKQNKTKQKIKCWESQTHCGADARWHSYLMKTDIGIQPAFAFGMENTHTHTRTPTRTHTAIQENIYYMTAVPYYQVNADWLYLTCSTSESQIANLKVKLPPPPRSPASAPWRNLRGSRPTNVQHRMTRMIVLFTGRRCVLVPLLCVYLLTGFHQQKTVLAPRERGIRLARRTRRSALILLSISVKSEAFSLIYFFFFLSLDNTLSSFRGT